MKKNVSAQMILLILTLISLIYLDSSVIQAQECQALSGPIMRYSISGGVFWGSAGGAAFYPAEIRITPGNRVVTNNSDGSYIFPNLPPGRYQVCVLTNPNPWRSEWQWQTTCRTVEIIDSDLTGVDFWAIWVPFTPTPTPTSRPTSPATPTATPTPTSTPDKTLMRPLSELPPMETGIQFFMSSDTVSPGDVFFITAELCNAEDEMMDIPVFILVDLCDTYFFWPSWTQLDPAVPEQLDYKTMTLPPGKIIETVIPEFIWPEMGDQPVLGMRVLGALVDSDFQSIIGTIAEAEWRYEARDGV